MGEVVRSLTCFFIYLYDTFGQYYFAAEPF